MAEPKTSESPRPFRDHWVLLGIVGVAMIAAAVMENRHDSIRAMELWGWRDRGVHFQWSWTVDSDPVLYGTCVKTERWLDDRGEVGRWLSTNIERVRRRFRSNFSRMDTVNLHDNGLRLLTEDEDFAVATGAVALGRARGADTLTFFAVDYDHAFNTDRDDLRYPELNILTERTDLVGRRARELVQLAGHMKFD